LIDLEGRCLKIGAARRLRQDFSPNGAKSAFGSRYDFYFVGLETSYRILPPLAVVKESHTMAPLVITMQISANMYLSIFHHIGAMAIETWLGRKVFGG
jgi:hypothetical protein